MIWEPLQFQFFRDALLASLLASALCGIIGSYVVVKRISSISGGLSHAALGGVGVAYYFSVNPLLGAAVFCLLCGVAMGLVYRRKHDSLDTLVSMVWSIGMAVGILFIAMKPGYAPDLTSYLFGNILFVTRQYIWLTAALLAAVLLIVAVLFKELHAVSFDEEFSEVIGVPVEPLLLLLISLMSLSVVVLIKVVGVILTISLLTIPAVIGRHWSSRLGTMMIIAMVICAGCSALGLFSSYWIGSALSVRLPTGPMIILMSVFCYLISLLFKARTR